MTGRVFSAIAILALAACVSAAMAQRNYPPEFSGAQAEVYKTVGDTDLKLWIFTPAEPSDEPRPAIVFFFGGGWKSGSPAQFENQCRYLASRGMVAITADYRVRSRHGVNAVACVEDAKSAIRWVRQHAERLGVDPARICAAGGSAGGHVACCAGIMEGVDAENEDLSVSSVPNAMALFNPAVQLAGLEGVGLNGISREKLKELPDRMGVDPQELSPVHHVRAGLPPTIIFHGEADTTVPFATVSEFTKRMRAAGNRCELNGFTGAPHGFFNLRESNDAEKTDQSRQWYRRTILQLDRFLSSLGWLEGPPEVGVVDNDHVRVRGSLANSLQKFQAGAGHVAFLGGSITEMNGYRPNVEAWLKQRFPDTKFTVTNAGISSTCSDTGAFRLERDVLSHGSVDLLLVEFAVNDDQDGVYSADQCVRGMEGIVRQLRQHNPAADIVMIHFVNPGMLETIQQDGEPLSSGQHERVARHYGVSSVYLSREVADRIAADTLTWKQFGGTHPGPAGNRLAADLVIQVLQAGWNAAEASTAPATVHEIPDEPLLDSSFSAGRLVSPDDVEIVSGWKNSEPDWDDLAGQKRKRFLGIPLLHATEAGATLKLPFDGTAVGAYVLAGPDAGRLDYQIDQGDWNDVDLFHHYSKGLHYPRTVMFATDLADGPHTVTVRVAEEHHPNSTGTAVRVLNFVVNGTTPRSK